MRVVVDTNVLVSGVLSASGPPGWIVEAIVAGELEPAFDGSIRAEYEDVLRRPELSLPPASVAVLLDALDWFGFEVTVPPWSKALPDPDDAPFLAVSASLGCPLVTGNLRHYPSRARGATIVLTPREFLNHLSREKP